MKKGLNKCPIAFCRGKEHCAALGMIKEASDADDLRNTMITIATRCLYSNNTILINAYNRKMASFKGISK